MGKNKYVLGIDVGGSGIKGAPVDIKKGKLLSERLRIDTPQPATPKAVAKTFAELVKMHDWNGPIGCGFPAIVRHGVAHSAANIDKKWIGTDVEKLFSKASGCPVKVMNDADAAGLAAVRYGAGKKVDGTVLMLTIGTGIGSALFIDGKLVPNTEFGHLFFKGMIAEHYAANSVRKNLELSWEEWGKRFNEYLLHIDRILSPDMVILSGGASKRFDEYRHTITSETKIIPSAMLNNAGTVGAAIYAWENL
ncbi:polyphosphate--glucose phosphotransferase [Flavilitoribacter nigricans]|uniref:Polyphosphate glucokinase n=1 Tax=Flavilitoribacter nigricans (strain ATCC 23147 / DSM 23189 / NBRC 102662 / NCIMB 1420 / SS-2) TaxID=1122177 RepID=A0A2D0N3B7_FLAN2|nr:ROK family protein [Flavilitoribacter nigricans]PHN03032.1 polyphosphate glucokinase [Flavilitoribacter nigricans DSM 23189 = NBRC 102662]